MDLLTAINLNSFFSFSIFSVRAVCGCEHAGRLGAEDSGGDEKCQLGLPRRICSPHHSSRPSFGKVDGGIYW